jgi:hypothetical protein
VHGRELQCRCVTVRSMSRCDHGAYHQVRTELVHYSTGLVACCQQDVWWPRIIKVCGELILILFNCDIFILFFHESDVVFSCVLKSARHVLYNRLPKRLSGDCVLLPSLTCLLSFFLHKHHLREDFRTPTHSHFVGQGRAFTNFVGSRSIPGYCF